MTNNGTRRERFFRNLTCSATLRSKKRQLALRTDGVLTAFFQSSLEATLWV